MEEEKWLPVRDFFGRYEVSNWGRIRSLPVTVRCGTSGSTVRTTKGTILATRCDSRGYQHISLRKSPETGVPSKLLSFSVHRLVATAYIPKLPGQGDFVNHVDSNPSNNRADNLEWCTCQQNMQHASANGRLYGVVNGTAKLTLEQVKEIRAIAKERKISQQALAKLFGVTQTIISRVLLGKTWTYGVARGVPTVTTDGPRNAKLTEDDVRYIKFDSRAKSTKFLSEMFGVTPECIQHIKAGKTWAHVT